ncbi:ABC transporter ATP-binding protein [Aneurinibacillus sp. Ricciae_BoGa-3]|uniref:ABC transporter ATP-binding protein n=1 Tax=Aneurinibacillus sp. Ricciae_BoGa-3 TaxID=3022697 RepID=UPI002340D344|nr:ABC transporter ATP-binding protein [Aneurinibacillus sp. Ricciae_BoGa-3]WCK55031.1 ABC transporter ATP-binding protein [Aneurinibacillus sp. Ricciae_BoGa-3]
MALLRLHNINTYYGGIHALKGISLEINEGEIVTLIGSNGAGKSTTLKAICGQVTAKEGIVEFNGQPITNTKPHLTAAMGIAHVPEGRRIFPKLTVRENLEMGAFSIKDKEWIKSEMDRCFRYFPRLKERIDQKGGTMSGGEQQMLAIARGLMSRPKILMLDEPSMGLAPILVRQIFDIIQELNSEGMTVLLVEQNANQALHIAHRGYVIQTGQIILEDDASLLLSNAQIKEAYLS